MKRNLKAIQKVYTGPEIGTFQELHNMYADLCDYNFTSAFERHIYINRYCSQLHHAHI
jgi:hypothetical protein